MDLFRDKYLLTKEYFERKSKTPEEETLTQQLNLGPQAGKEEEAQQEEQAPPPGRVLGHEALQGKIVGLFFSAGWCPPCQTFIALLCDLYDELQNRKSNFEVVFLSFDKSADGMEEYFRAKHRNWLALPFDDPFKDELKLKYNVTAVPRFIVIKRDGEVITARGRKEVQDKGVICFRNWHQASLVHEAKLAQATANAANAAAADGQTGENDGEKLDTTQEASDKSN